MAGEVIDKSLMKPYFTKEYTYRNWKEHLKRKEEASRKASKKNVRRNDE